MSALFGVGLLFGCVYALTLGNVRPARGVTDTPTVTTVLSVVVPIFNNLILNIHENRVGVLSQLKYGFKL